MTLSEVNNKYNQHKHIIDKYFINKIDGKKFRVNGLKVIQNEFQPEDYDLKVSLINFDDPLISIEVTFDMFYQTLNPL